MGEDGSRSDHGVRWTIDGVRLMAGARTCFPRNYSLSQAHTPLVQRWCGSHERAHARNGTTTRSSPATAGPPSLSSRRSPVFLLAYGQGEVAGACLYAPGQGHEGGRCSPRSRRRLRIEGICPGAPVFCWGRSPCRGGPIWSA
jgi:hypothetical protein